MCVTMSPGLSSENSFVTGVACWPMWIITGKSPATCCARCRTSKSWSPSAFRDRDHGPDAVGARGARVDPRRHAVLQRERRAVGAASRVRVDVDEPRYDELAGRVDRLGRGARELRVHGYDLAAHDADITDR